MAAEEIVLAGEPILKERAKHVRDVDSRIISLLDTLRETMRANKIIGITAPQIGVPLRVAVVEDMDGNVYDLVNPIISDQRGVATVTEECISAPKFCAVVNRARDIVCEYYDRKGVFCHLQATELFAFLIQHVVDHLDGYFMYDHAREVWIRDASVNTPLPKVADYNSYRVRKMITPK